MPSTRFLLLTLSLVIAASALGSEGPWVEKIDSQQYFAVSVEDMDRAVAWYRSAFGLEVLDDTAAETGAWRIVNLQRERLFVELIYDTRDAPKSRSRGIVKVGFRVADVRTIADRIEAATGERPRVLDFSRHDIRLIQLRDPENNIIQLTSPLTEASGVEGTASPNQRGRELMTQAIRALGGEAHKSVRSLRVVADCTHGESQFTTEVTSRRPDRTIFVQRAGDRATEMWVLGEEGFLLNPTTGERQPLNEPQRAMAKGHEFHFLLFELDQRFENPRVVGIDTAEGRGCTSVAVEDLAGRPAAICFDNSNHLPLILTYEPPGAPGKLSIVFEQWRQIDGVQYVTAFTLHQGEEVFTYHYHTIEPNAVPEDRFDRSEVD